jgi:hypothetical protein
MNWEEVGAIGQMLGSAAVLVTLWYLAVQQRHAREEVRRSVSQSRAAAVRELAIHYADNEVASSASFKAHLALGGQPHAIHKPLLDAGLTNEEIGAVIWREFAFWAYRQSTVMQIHELTAGERAEFDISIRISYGHGVGRLWYSTSKATLNPDAVRYIDNLLAQPV